MLDQLVNKLIKILTDWLLVLLGVSLILWFGIRLPVLNIAKDKSESQSLIVSESNLRSHVHTLIDYYAPRTIEYGNLDITAHYLHHELGKYGRVDYQSYWTLAGRYSNVILTLGPDTQEVFVIGAHYDAENDSLDIDGNASGVAALLELARLLGENEDKLPMQVSIVAYPLSQKNAVSLEKMGSFNHALLLREQQKDVKLMVSIDGVGKFNNSEKSQHYPYQFMQLFYPNKGDYISLIGRIQDYSEVMRLKESFASSTPLPIYSFNAPQSYSPTTSYDHINYQNQGFPAVLISDTADLREPNATGKNITEQLDYKKMALLVKGLYQVVMDSEHSDPKVQLVHQKVTKTP